MEPKTQAILAGAGGALVTFGILMWRKKSDLEARAASLQNAGPEAQDELARQAAQLEQELGEYGADYAEMVAQRTADHYIANIYGFTPERIARIGALASMFGF